MRQRKEQELRQVLRALRESSESDSEWDSDEDALVGHRRPAPKRRKPDSDDIEVYTASSRDGSPSCGEPGLSDAGSDYVRIDVAPHVVEENIPVSRSTLSDASVPDESPPQSDEPPSAEEYLSTFRHAFDEVEETAESDIDEDGGEEGGSQQDDKKVLREQVQEWGQVLLNLCLHHQVSVEAADQILQHVYNNLFMLNKFVQVLGRSPPRYKSFRSNRLKKLPPIKTSVAFRNMQVPNESRRDAPQVVTVKASPTYPAGYEDRNKFKRLWQEDYVTVRAIIKLFCISNSAKFSSNVPKPFSIARKL